MYERIAREPFNQSSWTTCLAGHTIRAHGEYGALRNPGPGDGVQVINFRTGAIRWTDDVAAELLGLIEDEAEWAFKVATTAQARDWLEDVLVAHDMRELDLLAAGFDANDYPISEVQG
ncbi:hypothetical protein [Nocardia africana]